MKKMSPVALAVALFIGLNIGTVSADGNQTIVEIASSNSDFSSLVEAVVSQDLVETLNSAGPFTVFAPTNSAFAALPEVVGKALAAKPELLTDVLLYHVVAGDVRAADVLGSETLDTVGGGTLVVDATNVQINDATIMATDIVASNGVIHVIDTVLAPQSLQDEVVRQLMIQLRDLYTTLRDLYIARGTTPAVGY